MSDSHMDQEDIQAQMLMSMLEQRLERIPEQNAAAKLSEAKEKLRAELAQLDSVFARLDENTRLRIQCAMIQEAELLAYRCSLVAAYIATEPLRDRAKRTGDASLIDEAKELFNELVA